jgi:hypothetical protein
MIKKVSLVHHYFGNDIFGSMVRWYFFGILILTKEYRYPHGFEPWNTKGSLSFLSMH